MRAIILSVGDELILGQTVDTNSAWISQQLASVGCEVAAHATVGDDQKAIEEAIRQAAARCDCLIISGGIGPTEDDLTRQALAAVMGAELIINPAWLDHLETFFRKINRPMSPLNRIQAMIPRGATMIENTAGTAAGIDATVRRLPHIRRANAAVGLRATFKRDYDPTCHIFVLPGVPKEMKIMFERAVLPHAQAAAGGAVILSRTLHTFGLGESSVADKLKAHGDLMNRGRNPSVGTTVSNGIVSLRLNARFGSRDEAERRLEQTVAECGAALGNLIFGEENDTLQGVVGAMLKAAGKTVTTAESCTGGLLAKMLTDVAGSSAYFKQGWVTYSNEAKEALLGVKIFEEGAVSEQTVVQMAGTACDEASADYALAISGIAGPGGGTATKPVGTVCIALAHNYDWKSDQTGKAAWQNDLDARTFQLFGDREMIRDRSAKMALTMLRFKLLGQPLPF